MFASTRTGIEACDRMESGMSSMIEDVSFAVRLSKPPIESNMAHGTGCSFSFNSSASRHTNVASQRRAESAGRPMLLVISCPESCDAAERMEMEAVAPDQASSKLSSGVASIGFAAITLIPCSCALAAGFNLAASASKHCGCTSTLCVAFAEGALAHGAKAPMLAFGDPAAIDQVDVRWIEV